MADDFNNPDRLNEDKSLALGLEQRNGLIIIIITTTTKNDNNNMIKIINTNRINYHCVTI